MFDIFNTINDEMAADEHMRNRAPKNSSFSDLFVVSIGGSLFVNENGPDVEKIRQIAGAINSLHSAGKRFVVVVGGGKIARSYIEVMRSFTQNNFDLDGMGIAITRANAMLLASAMPHGQVLTKIEKVKAILDSGKIAVFGGLMPFFTTDSVGALLAEHLNATFVNLTNVDGIYDSNPNEFPSAKRFDEIGYRKLVSLIVESGSTPGQNVVLDLACCLILQRSKIPAAVLSGNDIANFSNYINGSSFVGTTIRDIENEQISAPLPESEEVEVEKKRAHKKRKTSKKSGDYNAPNPYHIDFGR